MTAGYGFAYFRWRECNWQDFPGYPCTILECRWCAKLQRDFARLQGRRR